MTLQFTLQDVVASLGFEARKLTAAVDHHAGGYPLPHPVEFQKVIDRLSTLNAELLKVYSEQERVDLPASSGMKVEMV